MEERTVTLVNESGPNSRLVTATLQATGQLVISAIDTGPLVEQFHGDSDYEFWFTLAKDAVPALVEKVGAENVAQLLDVLATTWSGERFPDLEELLRDLGASFHSC
ncbi:MAG: hypothetical protein ACKO27_08915 [Ilumatobacteraceae bacterium]